MTNEMEQAEAKAKRAEAEAKIKKMMDRVPTTMKEAFQRDMLYLYQTSEGLSPEQKRDMIFVYALGWGSSLAVRKDMDGLKAWMDEYAPITDLLWKPDSTWSW